MKTTHSTTLRSAFFALLAIIAPLTVSASQEALVAAIGETQAEIAHAGNQLQITVKSLAALTHQESGDLRPTYDAYVANLTATESDGKIAADRAAKMAAAADTYFSTWQTEINGINNPDLKARAVKRMTAVQKDYGELTASLKATAAKFKPLLSDLNDVKATLRNDLTADGVKAVKSTANRASNSMESLHRELNDALGNINDILKALGTSAK